VVLAGDSPPEAGSAFGTTSAPARNK